MVKAALMLHCGAVPVTRTELATYKAPPPERRWFPVSHSRVLDVVSDTLRDSGYTIESEQLGVMRDGSRFFGVMKLNSLVAEGVSLAVGVRNSTDQSFPLSFASGHSVWVCDNTAFAAELLVRRKHTLRGERDFTKRIFDAVAQLSAFKEQEATRIDRLKGYQLNEDRADALILRAYVKSIIGARELPQVIREWREPQFADFQDRTGWALMNCFTTILRDKAKRQPHQHAAATMRLHALLDPSATSRCFDGQDPDATRTDSIHALPGPSGPDESPLLGLPSPT